MQWTEKQLQVIETGNRNLLVSAAAGSGKTAVLVERILRLISEGSDPADIDRLLVMTFTNAAAAEMRERIALAIERRLQENPEDEHLQVQAVLVAHAQITTIDSFCLNLIRDHFNLLDIDPSFRIGDPGELTLLKADVMERMLEEYYGKDDPVFERFVDTYATGKSDSGIEDYIMQVYDFAQSNPFPEDWAEECRRELEFMDAGDVMKTRWAAYLMKDAAMQLGEMAEQYEEIMEICREPSGPEVYLPALAGELEMLRRLAGAADISELYEALQTVAFGRLPAARGKDLDPALKEQVTECRNRIKKQVKDLCSAYGQVPPREALADMLGTKDVVLKLLELAETFSARYQEAKKDKNLADFNDLEHYALQILVEKREGKIHYTQTADELGARYTEILVDEYQDSNYVQEMLIQSLSRQRFGKPNVFMVGDVKQSIYRFRLARPELFMEKYDTYTVEESPCQKIELHRNFRSRVQVLESVNRIFHHIMTRKMGNVEYTEETALHPGAVFAEWPEDADPVQTDSVTEILLADTGKESLGGLDEEAAAYTARELEAKMAAARIRRLTDEKGGLLVWDRTKGAYRRAGYGDIVILLRSTAGWSEVFVQVLTREGIPAYAETGTGYFNTVEVETVLAMLAVIDNPIQDIPLAAVLKSPIVGMTDEELAWMMAAGKGAADLCQDRGIYRAFRRAAGNPEAVPDSGGDAASGGRRKARQFAALLEELRKQAAYLPIHQLIYQVYERTGYYDYVSAMPAGETRRANLDMLVEKASAYEKTSYKGLFQFIRYINLLKKYDTDFGEASAAGRYDNMVRIMSIHKSKGLEFPIVILSGLGKQFNRQDVRGKLVIDSDLGIGTDYLDLENRTKAGTLKKQVMKRKMDLDGLGEELRILYVAMTRAREKLIMTGTDRSLEKKLDKWQNPPDRIPCTVLSAAASCLDWVLMTRPQDSPLYQVRKVPVEELAGEEVARQIQRHVSKTDLMSPDAGAVHDGELQQELEKCFSYRYPHQADVGLHTKMTVSELKKQSQREDDFQGLYQPEEAGYLKEESPKASGESDFSRMQEEKAAMEQAARRGTAYHRVLELLDFTSAELREDVESQLDALGRQGRITESARELVRPELIWRLASSPLGQRMKAAQEKGLLSREQQFVMGIPAREMGLGDTDEPVLIQGIIDACFQEGGGLVIVDYKTDRISRGGEELLARRYRTQLDYYQKALEQITGRRVTERIIYSLSLQKEIPV